jgi:hypothetical protein
MTEFSALRSSAGFELLDIAEQFDAPFPSVARWEIGLEDAPAQILEALRIASVGGSMQVRASKMHCSKAIAWN